MVCPSCRRENPEGAAFCGGCGAALGPARPTGPIPPQPYPPAPPRTSGLAVASLVCGVLGLLCLPPVIAPLIGVVLGVMALSAIGRSGGQLQGQGIAVAGVVSSGIGVLALPIVAALLFPVFAQARERARLTSCMSNEKQLALGVLMYTQDYDGIMPRKSNWVEALDPYTRSRSLHRCPSATPPSDRSYAYNAKLDRMPMAKVAQPAAVAMLFDANGAGDSPSGGPEIVARRHLGRQFVLAYVDGHARTLVGPNADSVFLRWDPGLW